MAIFRAREPFSFDADGCTYVISPGDTVTEDHPAYAGREHLFEPIEEYAARREASAGATAPAHDPHGGVEDASAAPGDRRSLRIGKLRKEHADAGRDELDDLSSKELKKLLAEADLPLSGNKDTLADRLREHRRSQETDDQGGVGDTSSDGYDDKDVEELQELLRERDLSDEGEHDDLVARLREADAANSDGD